MDSATWASLTPAQRHEQTDWSHMSPQLNGFLGCRVEVVDLAGNKRRFIVGKSTGWVPCHLEIKTRRSRGGIPADKEYVSVKFIEKVR